MLPSDLHLHPLVAPRLTPQEKALALEDEDWLRNEIYGERDSVLYCSWDLEGWGPGTNGAIWVHEWKGLYFLRSSDFDDDGPFASLEEACGEIGWLGPPRGGFKYGSSVLDEAQLLEWVASGFEGEVDDVITINDHLYVWTGTGFKPAPDE